MIEMRKIMLVLVLILIMCFVSFSLAFYLHIGQEKSEVIAALGQPNYTDISVDSVSGKVERCQWGSERVGAMVIIYFKDGRVLRFETKGKVN
jgi:hypothetical protein